MIKSITFTGERGYIGERWTEKDKPAKPKKTDCRYRKYSFETHRDVVDDEKFNDDMERYKEEMKTYRKVKNQYKVSCSEILVGRKFEFASDKINLIFGPNASGKTTIIKGIAAHAFCKDGFSSFVRPIDFRIGFGEKRAPEKYTAELLNLIGNTSSVVEWDGSPIYFHNFDNRPNYGSIGDLQGSIIENTAEELMYIMDKNQQSAGQTMFYQFHKLAGMMSRNVTYDDLLNKPYGKYGKSDKDNPWRLAYDAQEAYYRSFPMAYNPNGQNTYLFDEIDKSMDILNIHALYASILPGMMKKYNKQIIIISHSPIVLSDEVYNSDKYNFISMDEEYTEKCRKILS